MGAAAGKNREIEQLKTLLFEPEAARLETLEKDISALQQYVGSAERLQISTAEVLVSAIERAEVNQSRQLANAIAPSVVSAIRKEIQNSRDLMVDALYPITGRLVSAAVANAFKELIASLEQRINTLTSAEIWIGRIKSLITGRPIGEFVLARGGALHVKRLLIIERGNGRLIADWTQDKSVDQRAELLSAMVAAIVEFSVQALNGGGELQKLDFGGSEIVLRASPRFILAAECIGSLRYADDTKINSLFFDAIERIGSDAGANYSLLATLAESIESKSPAAGTNSRGKYILYGVLGILAAFVLWLAWTWMARSAIEQRAVSTLQEFTKQQPLLESFPLRLEFDHHNRSVAVHGIEPSQVETVPLIDELIKTVAPYRVVDRIGIVPGLEQSIKLNADMAKNQQLLIQIGKGIDEMRDALAQESASRNSQYAELGKQLTNLTRQYAALQAIIDGPSERLTRFLSSGAIFFGEGDEFLNPKETNEQLKELANLLAGNDLRVRIVGYADESGTESVNRALGRSRAERVRQQLLSLGADPSRLFVVSRSASMPISDRVGSGNGGNRRVTFENVFRSESQN